LKVAKAAKNQLWKKQSSAESDPRADFACCGGLCWYSPNGVSSYLRKNCLLTDAAADSYLQWPVSRIWTRFCWHFSIIG